MRFFRAKGGIFLALLGALAAAGVLFLILGGDSFQTQPEGTLVQRKVVEAVL